MSAPPNKRQAPEPARAAPYGQAIPVSDGHQSLSLRPVCASKLGFTPDARLRLTMFGDEPLDGTSPPSLTAHYREAHLLLSFYLALQRKVFPPDRQ